MTEESAERNEVFKKIYVTELSPQLKVYCQFVDGGAALEMLLTNVSMRGGRQ